MKILLQILFLVICINYSFTQDPFSALGIPNLNPSQIFNSNEGINQIKENNISKINSIPKIKTVEDLQKFLKKGNFDEPQGLTIVSKFLIADDIILKKNGAVFDLTGYDGLNSSEMVYPAGSGERLFQRAKSAARLFISNTYNDETYEAMGVEDITKFSGTWRIYKVLLSGKNSYANHIFLKVCLPIDESLTPLVSNLNDDCISKIQLVEESRIKNLPYLEKIKNSNIFRKTPINKDLINERIQKENYNNMMKNYNNFMQNQNSIQTPPSIQMKNGLSTNLNQAQNNFLNNNNVKPILNNNNNIQNNIINGLGNNNLVGTQNSDAVNLSKHYNMNVNSIDNNTSLIKRLTNEKEENDKNSDESKKGNDFSGNDVSFMENQSTLLSETSANKADSPTDNNENPNGTPKTDSNNNSGEKTLDSAKEATNLSKESENEVNNSIMNNNEIKNQLPNQFNNINMPQQANNLQAYTQGIQQLTQNNSQANNYLMNQAQIMKNQLMAQQNAMNDQQKLNNLRGLPTIDNRNPVQNNLIPNTNNIQNTINPANNSIPSPMANPSKNMNPSQSNLMAIINRMNLLEIQIKNDQILNQAMKNEVINIRNYSDANFKKLEAAINQLAGLLKK